MGYVLLCGGTAAQQRATQTTTVATSTAEAEGMAQTEGTRAQRACCSVRAQAFYRAAHRAARADCNVY